MKVAVAVEEKKENAQVSERAGRATYYLVFEVNNKEANLIETLDNPFKMGSGGAGFAVAKMLADKGIDMIVAGKFGGNMIGAMEERNVKYKIASGNARDVAINAAK